MTSFEELAEKVETLQNVLISKATGTDVEEHEYVDLRRELMADRRIRDKLPRFVRTCHSTGQFWAFIQPRFETYKERRKFLWAEFGRVLELLEESSTQADSPEPEIVQPRSVSGAAGDEAMRGQKTNGGATKESASSRAARQYKYDVAISFAGSERSRAEKLATMLRAEGVDVFYDAFYQDDLWGRDLATYFADVYKKDSRYCVIFVSQEYLDRIWTTHERRHAVARLIEEKGERYILPIRVEPVQLPGVPPSLCYLDLDQFSDVEIGRKLIKLVRDSQ